MRIKYLGSDNNNDNNNKTLNQDKSDIKENH